MFEREKKTAALRRIDCHHEAGQQPIADEAGFPGEHGARVESDFDRGDPVGTELHIGGNVPHGAGVKAHGGAGEFLGFGAGGDPLKGGVATGIQPHPFGPVAIDGNPGAPGIVAGSQGKEFAAKGIELAVVQQADRLGGEVDLHDVGTEEVGPEQTVDATVTASAGTTQIEGENFRWNGDRADVGLEFLDRIGDAAAINALDGLGPPEFNAEPTGDREVENARSRAGIEEEVKRFAALRDGDLQPDHPILKLEGQGSDREQRPDTGEQEENNERKETARMHGRRLASVVQRPAQGMSCQSKIAV